MRMLNVCTVLCGICGKDLEKASRIIHHCHPSGTLIGVAFSKFNLIARIRIYLLVFSLNLSRHGAQPNLKQLKLKVSEELSTIDKTDEIFLPSVSLCLWDYTHKVLEKCKTLPIDALPRYSPVCIPKLGQSSVNTQNGRFPITQGFFSTIPDQLYCYLTQKRFLSLQFPKQLRKNWQGFYQLSVTHGKAASMVRLIIPYMTINMHLTSTEYSFAQTWKNTTASM